MIIGGGIVGLAAARECVLRFPRLRLVVLEKENRVGIHQTGHNSGVIHSGLYYRPGSIKAKTCVEGAAAMGLFCQEHGIPYKLYGKVVVATNEQELPALRELHLRGTANGVPDLLMIGPEQLREIEPHACGIQALHVPGTGITDFVSVAEKFAEMGFDGNTVYEDRLVWELGQMRKQEMYPFIRCLVYVIDEFRKHDILWGVGRGSSCSSLVMFILGINRVDPIKYNIDPKEFFK